MEKHSRIMEGWRAKLEEYEQHPDHFTFASAPPFKVLSEWRAPEDAALLAALYEAIGMADLPLIRAHPEMVPLTALESLGYLVTAAHLYRRAGDRERSALGGERALLELKATLRQVGDGSFRLPATYVRWYIVEMAGDAAVCCQPVEAGRLYREAEEGFRGVDAVDQRSDLADPFPGDYLARITHPALLPGFPRELEEKGSERVAYKLRHWVRP